MMYRAMAGLLAVMSLAPALQAAEGASGFGPLATPAKINTAMAMASRMTAVTRAGERVVAVGPRGHILISDQVEGPWRQVPVPVSSDLVAVHFVDDQHGWAAGHDGVVLHTSDGGEQWQKQLDGHQAAALIEAFFADNGEQLSEEAQFEAQRFIDEGADKPFLDVYFQNAREGFVVGAFNLAFRTRDGGESWEPLLDRIDNPMGYHLYSLNEAGGRVWMAGEKGLLLRWDAEQERFAEVNSPYAGSYFGVIGSPERVVVFGLRGNAWVSTDQGDTWSRLDTGFTDSITGGAFLDASRFVLVTQGAKVRLSNAAGDRLEEVEAGRPMSYADVAVSTDGELVLVGSGGVRVAPYNQIGQVSNR